MDPVTYQPPHIWGAGISPMDFSNYPHPTFTCSPPATPMTPMTPALNHHHFPLQYDIPHHIFPNGPPPPPPPPPPPFPPPPDYRLFALCQHLQTYSKVCEPEMKRWWEEFMMEFFHDNSTLVIETDLGEGTRKYHLTRQWIPLYFQSLMENGVTSMHLDLGQCISTYHQNLQELECHNATMETNHTSPHPTKVCTSGSLVVDFSLEEKPRILSWYFKISDHTEYIPRGNSTQTGKQVDNITNKGILPSTQKLLLETGRVDSNVYQGSPIPNSNPPSADGLQQQWQDMQVMMTIHPGLNVLQPSQLKSEGPGMSPRVVAPNSMTILSNSSSSPIIYPTASTSSTSTSTSKTKSSRSSPHGSRKRQSPIPCSSMAANSGGSSVKKAHQFVLVASEAIPLKDADNLPFGLEERMITRIDNKTGNRASTSSSSSTKSSSSPTNDSNSINQNGTTSKLCHLNNHHHHHHHHHSKGLSHSTTVESSTQGVEVGQGQPEMYALQPWTTDGLTMLNHGSLASTR